MSKTYFYKNAIIILAVDVILVAFSWYFSYLLRFNFSIPEVTEGSALATLPLVIAIKILTFHFFKLYQGMWRYTSLPDLANILKASTSGSLIIILIMLFSHGFAGFPRSVFIIDWCITLLLISGCRVGIRLYFWMDSGDKSAQFSRLSFFSSLLLKHNLPGKKLLVIGAGNCGEKIVREIRENPQLGYQVAGFIDDHPSKANLQIHGIPVVGKTDEIKTIANKMGIEELLIAIPSASYKKMRSIVGCCDGSGIPFKTVPSMSELINGRVTVKAIRDVRYKDLLGREPVKLDELRIGGCLKGARVIVTGAGGSIGSELCRQICRFRPSSIILFERAESPLYEIELELKKGFPDVEIVPMLADVSDRRQLSFVFEAYRPQVVFHAAAYKHVPLLELQPWKSVINNILGTRNMIDISKQFSVERFVFVSTDKAVRPTNVMGASKRVAELLVHGQNGCELSDKKFMAVRFGNVVGSAGSVVPLFKRQIAYGGPVTVTHPEVTRYFMTIPEACQLILQAGSMGNGGETFVLDMGTPVKISDMARDLIRLSGYEPDVDIKIEFIGLRPGEKLYEELITEDEGIAPTGHGKIMVLRGQSCDQAVLNGQIDELFQLAAEYDSAGIRAKLCEIVPEFHPENGDEIEENGRIKEAGKSQLTFVDRRSEKRFRPMNGSVVIPDFDSKSECRIVDISRGGLSFYYNGKKNFTQDFLELALGKVNDGLNLDNIPCKFISQRAENNAFQLDDKEMKRFSVKFGELTQVQRDQLASFLENHTVPMGT